ncbi:hypothetical protein KFE25_013382 [Diacronema lutheri]|uniref:Uncharacterized protein n=1 Tax=Diacronema lutheri TaxID=2081491 RepID=A0A8J5XQB6_DIALT|nr:hypothetical protein KFE25_013382 [Diacronema lutheri]
MRLALALSVLLALAAGEQVLGPGDVALIGFNARATPDLICMWVLTNVEAGTQISIAGVGLDSWVATYAADGDIGAGEVICLNDLSQPLTTNGEVIGAPIVATAPKRAMRRGERALLFGGIPSVEHSSQTGLTALFVYQGDEELTQFIYALSLIGTFISDAGPFLPTGLTPGLTAVALHSNVRGYYNGVVRGAAKQALLLEIGKPSNWVMRDAEVALLPDALFNSHATPSAGRRLREGGIKVDLATIAARAAADHDAAEATRQHRQLRARAKKGDLAAIAAQAADEYDAVDAASLTIDLPGPSAFTPRLQGAIKTRVAEYLGIDVQFVRLENIRSGSVTFDVFVFIPEVVLEAARDKLEDKTELRTVLSVTPIRYFELLAALSQFSADEWRSAVFGNDADLAGIAVLGVVLTSSIPSVSNSLGRLRRLVELISGDEGCICPDTRSAKRSGAGKAPRGDRRAARQLLFGGVPDKPLCHPSLC